MRRRPSGVRADVTEVVVHTSREGDKPQRQIILVPRDGGELRVISNEELLAGMVKTTAVAMAKVEGRPDAFPCPECQVRMVLTPPRGRAPKRCDHCRAERLKMKRRAYVKLWRQRHPETAKQRQDAANRRTASDPDRMREYGRRAQRRLAEIIATDSEAAGRIRAARAEYSRRYRAKKRAERLAAEQATNIEVTS